jgi:hypothetical protein
MSGDWRGWTLGDACVDGALDRRVAVLKGVVDADKRSPCGRYCVLGEDRLNGTFGLARATVDTLFRVDYEHAADLVDAVHGADVDTRSILHVNARFGDDVCHGRVPFSSSSGVVSMMRQRGPRGAIWKSRSTAPTGMSRRTSPRWNAQISWPCGCATSSRYGHARSSIVRSPAARCERDEMSAGANPSELSVASSETSPDRAGSEFRAICSASVAPTSPSACKSNLESMRSACPVLSSPARRKRAGGLPTPFGGGRAMETEPIAASAARCLRTALGLSPRRAANCATVRPPGCSRRAASRRSRVRTGITGARRERPSFDPCLEYNRSHAPCRARHREPGAVHLARAGQGDLSDRDADRVHRARDHDSAWTRNRALEGVKLIVLPILGAELAWRRIA